MRARYPQPDGRSIARRKRSAFKLGGPLVHFCELLQKKLIQDGFAACYVVKHGRGHFFNALGETPEFLSSFSIASYIVARSQRIEVILNANAVSLGRDYFLVLRYGKTSTKPVAVTFKALPSDPPF